MSPFFESKKWGHRATSPFSLECQRQLDLESAARVPQIHSENHSANPPALLTVYGGVVYQQPAQLAQSFAALSGIPLTVNARGGFTIVQEMRRFIGTLPPHVTAWSLSTNHAYNPSTKVLFLGAGGRRSAQAIDAVITTVAGSGPVSGAGRAGFSGDGGLGTLRH